MVVGDAPVVLGSTARCTGGGGTRRTRVHGRSASAGSSAASARGRRSPSDGGSVVDEIRRVAVGKGSGMV
jgi:hypothetical protein